MKPQILRDLRFLFSLVVAMVSPLLFSRVACGPTGFRAPRGTGLRRGRRSARVMVLLVAPLVFRAPEGPAAREARASLRSAPRLEARPCPPVPPAPSTPVGPGCFVCPWAAARPRAVRAASLRLGASPRSPARPRRRPRAPQPGPAIAHGHRSLARCFLGASRGSRVLSFWGAWVRVVTNVVNPRAFELKMVVFGLRLTTFVTGVLAR